jgi:hypothetical protein
MVISKINGNFKDQFQWQKTVLRIDGNICLLFEFTGINKHIYFDFCRQIV